MNILFITHRYPYPPNRGDSIRSFHFLKRMAQMGTVCLATLYDQEPLPEWTATLNDLCEEVIAEPWGRRKKWLRAGMSLLRGKTMTEGLFFHPRLKRRIRELALRRHFDVVVFFCSSMTPYRSAFRGITPMPRMITDLVDVDSQKWFDYSRKASGWKKVLFHIEGSRLRKLEKRIADFCESLVVTTPEEAALYRSFCPVEHLTPIPNGVDTVFFHSDAIPEMAEIPHRCVFVGAMDYHANVDGVFWFLENVLPQIRAKYPDCALDVVGSRPVPELKRRCENTPGAHLVGTVPDVRPYLKRAAVVVIPLQVARGIQNKVLEACSMGRPVVVSPGAAEGIHADAGTDFLVCDTPESWVKTLDEVFRNPELRNHLSLAGRRMTEMAYGWPIQLDKLEALLGKDGNRP
ncbi:MAG: TIGR03087 family PEP-CTERM/XrtA system glycosyltransferase [Planctomycetia bacterium]|nr:TIGR03087 family PEP-CTERM/XrtA system glycosyltransferase [Planctomycetia bacterium]